MTRAVWRGSLTQTSQNTPAAANLFEKCVNLALVGGQPNCGRAAVVATNEVDVPLRQPIAQTRLRIAVAVVQVDHLHNGLRVDGFEKLGGARRFGAVLALYDDLGMQITKISWESFLHSLTHIGH